MSVENGGPVLGADEQTCEMEGSSLIETDNSFTAHSPGKPSSILARSLPHPPCWKSGLC